MEENIKTPIVSNAKTPNIIMKNFECTHAKPIRYKVMLTNTKRLTRKTSNKPYKSFNNKKCSKDLIIRYSHYLWKST